MHIFLSHNQADKDVARRLGSNLLITGAEVWFDEWEVSAGDSLPGKIGEGLAEFDTFVLLWSANAARSDWVRAELEAAFTRRMDDGSLRIIPIRLDDTEAPTLLRNLKYLKYGDDDGIPSWVDEIMGFQNERDRLRAMQQTFEDLVVDVRYFHGYGALVACPRCGVGVDAIEQWSATDPRRDDLYAGARCTECGWEDGTEV